MFFMYLRDVYQHSNADAGRLTNSRVCFTNLFTRWAVFVSSQDMHIRITFSRRSHTISSAGLHELLKRNHEVYHDQVLLRPTARFTTTGDAPPFSTR